MKERGSTASIFAYSVKHAETEETSVSFQFKTQNFDWSEQVDAFGEGTIGINTKICNSKVFSNSFLVCSCCQSCNSLG